MTVSVKLNSRIVNSVDYDETARICGACKSNCIGYAGIKGKQVHLTSSWVIQNLLGESKTEWTLIVAFFGVCCRSAFLLVSICPNTKVNTYLCCFEVN